MSLKNGVACKPEASKASEPVRTGRHLSYEGECGMCVRCKEWTEVGASCCGSGVYFEGGFVADFDEEGA